MNGRHLKLMLTISDRKKIDQKLLLNYFYSTVSLERPSFQLSAQVSVFIQFNGFL